jgi:hypothetical protein
LIAVREDVHGTEHQRDQRQVEPESLSPAADQHPGPQLIAP